MMLTEQWGEKSPLILFKMVPTAEKFRLDIFKKLKNSQEVKHLYDDEDINDIMIEFAKLHVTAALEEASNQQIGWPDGKLHYMFDNNVKSVIRNAYPLADIK